MFKIMFNKFFGKKEIEKPINLYRSLDETEKILKVVFTKQIFI